ncbi:cation efflux system protein [Alcanivorax jadensis T9]|jgi:cobalt-zinc-cadmium resistance protein CzcA|uniref:Cation efflux system protein n=1 Tax=Alcanivorax jadensis T9 TaxID=1177181 RepID=A0ABR4W908_9GAMM|nr:CusA/CzcA family heavy metal efflux RND transporter [Alcanivorax jadensis]KGD59737.1 cation efflux system protein [Alcanivorax jadensis T9]
MFNRLVDWAVNNRLIVLLLLIITIGVIGWQLPNLKLDAFPDVTNVQVQVNTEAEGLAAEEVEQLITYPIEAVMYALPQVAEVRSISKTGLSIVTVVFEEGTDIYFARQLVFERLQAAREDIPDGVGTPEMGPNTSGLGQVYQYLLTAEPGSNVDAMQLRSLNDWVVKLLLMPVGGVTDVLSYGGEVRQYQVNVNPTRLLAYDLSLQQVMDAIAANNRNAGGWYLDRGAEQLVIRGMGWVGSGEQGLGDIAAIPLKEVDGTQVRVRDVAKVEFGGEIRQGALTMTRRDANGEPEALGEVVAGIVLKRMGANTKATIDGIKAREARIQQALPDGVQFEVFYDQADLVEKAVSTVVTALLLAFVFIVIVLALFLMNLRATALVLLSIPLSIGLALLAMASLGMSANLMSLGGLAVAIGMLVDGSVVMVENIFKHLSQKEGSHDSQGGIALRVKDAAQEVARPVFFAASIILVVFLPLFAFEGVEAKMFVPMAISIMLAMTAAVLVALIVVPALAGFLFRNGVEEKPNKLMQWLEARYRTLLGKAMQARKVVVGGAVGLFALALATTPFIGTEFVPVLEEGTLALRVTLAPSSSLDTALDVGKKLEKEIMAFPEVTYALSRVGRAEIGGDPEPVSNVEIYIGLKPVDEWESASNRLELQEKIQQKLEKHPGLLLNFSQPIAMRVDELLSGVKAQLAIKLFGPDLDVLQEKGEAITQAVKEVEGATDVQLEQIAGEAQLVVTPDRNALSRYGLSVDQVMDLVSNGLGGGSAGQVINGNERYDIYVRLEQNARMDAEAIRNLRLKAADGAWVRLMDVADVSLVSGPPQISRDDVQRRVVIQANVAGRDMGSVVADIQQAIDSDVDLPAGYSVDIGGQYENQQRAQQRLAMVVPVAVGLIALLLYFAFGSVAQAALILVNVPLALIGGILALAISGQYLSVPSSVGFITLFGVAVLNGVVMVEAINHRLRDGEALETAIFEGAVSRLRPVLMTALTSMLGLIPMLLATGVGSEVQRPLAVVIVGGLVSATALTLLVLPSLYGVFSKGNVEDLRR